MLSVIILTHNDEDKIAKTLESVSFAEEIIIIDDDSNDLTCDVAIKYKPKIFIHPLTNDFSKQRNFGLTKAKGDWILFIDSDEIVTPLLQKEILGQIKNNPNINGYFLKRTDFFSGRELKHGETANVKLLRLARKDTGKWVRSVHETWVITGKTDELINPLSHYPHPTITEFLSEINRYSSLNAKFFYDQGVRVNLWQIIGYPLGKFIINYILKLGFLDGIPGIIVALMMSFHSFLTRAKIYTKNFITS
jgi:glycosyltransferase involved in cell wall biosynthesis